MKHDSYVLECAIDEMDTYTEKLADLIAEVEERLDQVNCELPRTFEKDCYTSSLNNAINALDKCYVRIRSEKDNLRKLKGLEND